MSLQPGFPHLVSTRKSYWKLSMLLTSTKHMGRMTLCSKSVVEPLSMIFNNCIDTGTFPDIWKQSNIIPVHQKGDEQFVDNYRPVSLLPIFRKNTEKLLFNSIMDFLEECNLLNSNQSGFRPNNSCETQFLLIVHDIYSQFDGHTSPEVRGTSLYISKAFDRVWHEGLFYIIQSIEISGTALIIIESFSSGRYQRVLLNDQASSQSPVLAFRATLLSDIQK